MTYRIEITADTLNELAGKAAALASQLNASCPVMPEVAATVLKPAKATPAPKPKAAPAPAPEPVAEEIEDAVVEDVAEEAPAPAPEPVAPTPEPVAQVLEPDGDEENGEISYDKHIAPGVVAVVTKCGKPVMAEILSQFGAAKASHIDPKRYPELLEAIRDALGSAD